MNRELAHSFNITLESPIASRMRIVQERLAETISELRNYDSAPHLAIATKLMQQEESDAFVRTLAQEFAGEKAWELTFSGFAASETGSYVFLHLSPESREKMFALHLRAMESTRGIGGEGSNGQPPKYPYDPHISIIKLPPEKKTAALARITDDFSHVRMAVTRYEMTREQLRETGFADFPRIGSIELRAG